MEMTPKIARSLCFEDKLLILSKSSLLWYLKKPKHCHFLHLELVSCVGLVNRGEFCTFGFLYSDDKVAGPGDVPGHVQKAKSAKIEQNHPR